MLFWMKRLGLVCLLWVLFPSAIEAATYKCRVTVKSKEGKVLEDKEVEVKPFLFFQTPEGMAARQVVPGNLTATYGEADIFVYCWEIQKPKLWGFIPVVYSYPSDKLTGITIAYAVPIELGDAAASRGIAAASLGQNTGATTPVSNGPAGLDFSVVGEVGIAKADFSNALTFAGGARAAKPLSPTLDAFGQFMVGVTHFSGENDFTVKPEGGVLFSPKGKPFSVQAFIGLPIIFFTGAHERGFEVGGGIVLPGRRRQ